MHEWWSDDKPNKLNIKDLEKLINSILETDLRESLKTIQVEKGYKQQWKKLRKVLGNNCNLIFKFLFL